MEFFICFGVISVFVRMEDFGFASIGLFDVFGGGGGGDGEGEAEDFVVVDVFFFVS